MESGRDEATGVAGVGSDQPVARTRAPFESIETETLSRRIGRRLIGDIVSGDFRPGDEIPSEDQLAREFGVSRPVVREAVKHLSVLGLVQSRQGRQSRVAPYESWNHFAPEILAARREAGAVEDVLIELLELRRMVEVEAAALAAARATTDDIEAMTAAIAVLDASVGEPRAFTQADIAFHDAILRATKNHLLPRLFDLLRPLIEFGREISVTTRPHGPTVSQQGHVAVFEAIRAGSPTDARLAMEDHLSWTANLDFGERSVRVALDDARRDPAARPAATGAATDE
jgi:GntR family transcriptional regulator, transcriptional repressor for pyruvate dehydrogenase complex